MIVKISRINTANGVRSVAIIRHVKQEPIVLPSGFGPMVRVVNGAGNTIDYISTPALQITKVKIIGG